MRAEQTKTDKQFSSWANGSRAAWPSLWWTHYGEFLCGGEPGQNLSPLWRPGLKIWPHGLFLLLPLLPPEVLKNTKTRLLVWGFPPQCKADCPALSSARQAENLWRRRTPAEALCDMAGASTTDAAANMERGSVPSSIELRGSVGADDEEEEDEEVLPLRAPRRVLVSVTWTERRVMFGGESRHKLRNYANIVQLLHGCERWKMSGDMCTTDHDGLEGVVLSKFHQCGLRTTSPQRGIVVALTGTPCWRHTPVSTSLTMESCHILITTAYTTNLCLHLFLSHSCHHSRHTPTDDKCVSLRVQKVTVL